MLEVHERLGGDLRDLGHALHGPPGRHEILPLGMEWSGTTAGEIVRLDGAKAAEEGRALHIEMADGIEDMSVRRLKELEDGPGDTVHVPFEGGKERASGIDILNHGIEVRKNTCKQGNGLGDLPAVALFEEEGDGAVVGRDGDGEFRVICGHDDPDPGLVVRLWGREGIFAFGKGPRRIWIHHDGDRRDAGHEPRQGGWDCRTSCRRDHVIRDHFIDLPALATEEAMAGDDRGALAPRKGCGAA